MKENVEALPREMKLGEMRFGEMLIAWCYKSRWGRRGDISSRPSYLIIA